MTDRRRAYGLRIRYTTTNFLDLVVHDHKVTYDESGVRITQIEVDRVDGLPGPSFNYEMVVSVEPLVEQAVSNYATGITICSGTTSKRRGAGRCKRRTNDPSGFCDNHRDQARDLPSPSAPPVDWQQWTKNTVRQMALEDAAEGVVDDNWETALVEWWVDEMQQDCSEPASTIVTFAKGVVAEHGDWSDFVATMTPSPTYAGQSATVTVREANQANG